MNNYKKFLDKAKKDKDSSGSSDKEKLQKQIAMLKKFAMGTSKVKPEVNESEMDNDGQARETQQQSYQAKDYFGKGDGDSSGPLSRMSKGGPVYPKGQFKNEDFSDKGLRTIIPRYAGGTNNVYASPTPPPSSPAEESFFDSLRKSFKAPPTPDPSPSGETQEQKFARIRQQNQERSMGTRPAQPSMDQSLTPSQRLGYAEGTPNAQTPEEAGAEAVERRKALLRNANISPDQSDDEIEAEAEERARLKQEPKYNKGTMDVPKNSVVKPSTNPGNRSQALKNKDRKPFHFDGGTPNVPSASPSSADLANATNVAFGDTPTPVPVNAPTMNGVPDTSSASLDKGKAAAEAAERAAIRKSYGYDANGNQMSNGGTVDASGPVIAVSDHEGMNDNGHDLTPGTQSESPSYYSKGGKVKPQKDDIYSKYMRLSGGLPSVPKLEKPLAKVHAPSDKKYPLNIPRGAKMHFPKRLKSINSISGFDEGTPYVEGTVLPNNPDDLAPTDSQDLSMANQPNDVANAGRQLPVDISYPQEEEDANKVVDQSTQGQLQQQIDDHNQGQDVLQQIDKALGKPAKDEDYPKFDDVKSYKTLQPMDTSDEDDEKSKRELSEDDSALKDDKQSEDLNANKDDHERKQKQDDLTDADHDREDERQAKEIPFKEQNPGTRLKQAQFASNLMNTSAKLGQIADIAAGSMGHFKPQYQEFYEQAQKDSDLPVKQLDQQMQMEKFDPNSATSKSFRQYLAKFGGQDIKELGDISAADAAQIAPMAFKQFEAQQAQKANEVNKRISAQERLAQVQLQVEQKREAAQEHNDTLKMMAADKAQRDAASKQERDAAAKTKAEAATATRTDQALFGFRQPPDVKQARLDHYNAEKGLNTIRSFENAPGGLDKMDPGMVANVRAEVQKIAQSGAPTEGGLNKFDPNTFPTRLASLWQQVSNKPTSANAGAFLKEYKDYLGTMQSTAGPLINSYNQSILQNNKRTMNPDDYDQRLNSEYVAPYLKYNKATGASKQPASQPATNNIPGFDPDAFLKGNR